MSKNVETVTAVAIKISGLLGGEEAKS